MQHRTMYESTLTRLSTVIDHEVNRVERLQQQVSRLRQVLRNQQQPAKEPSKPAQDSENPFDKILLA
jgi:predicted HicB family RNase H-like nuclease